MPTNIDQLLKQAEILEQDDSKAAELAQLYREIATIYHKEKNQAKNQEYLAKSREAKGKIKLAEPKISLSIEGKFEQIKALPDSNEKYDILKKFVEKHPKFTMGCFFLGYLATNLGLFYEAKKIYEHYLNISDSSDKINNANAYNNLGIILGTHLRIYDKAKEYYKKAIELLPNDAETWYNFANLLSNDYFKDYEQAKRIYQKVIDLKLDDVDAYYRLAILLYQRFNDIENAQKNFLKGIEIDQTNDIPREALRLISNFEKPTFISELEIKKVRHQRNIEIKLSESERKHLFLTGKNGCGKTSVLKEMENYMQQILGIPIEEIFTERGKREFWLDTDTYALKFNVKQNLLDLRLKYEAGSFVVAFFGDDRIINAEVPKAIEKVELNVKTLPKEDLSKNFIKYLVYQDYKMAKIKGEEKVEIEKFFEKVRELLILIYKDENIKFNSGIEIDELDFYIELSNGNKFTFNQLSAGYSAIFKIIFEIILRTQKTSAKTDTEGIILIDEPETHLHVELQKEIMPMLVKLFPRVQFIVATHSPFILNSLANAVVYDLEKKERFEDASLLSYWGLVETYFDANQYSKIALSEIAEYEQLVDKYIATEEFSSQDFKRMERLRMQFENMPSYFSKELSIKFNQIELKRLNHD